jgi:hypothetical protein
LTQELAELNNRDRVPVTFGSVIETWANRTNAPKKGKQDRTTKANRFADFLGRSDMARVTRKLHRLSRRND